MINEAYIETRKKLDTLFEKFLEDTVAYRMTQNLNPNLTDKAISEIKNAMLFALDTARLMIDRGSNVYIAVGQAFNQAHNYLYGRLINYPKEIRDYVSMLGSYFIMEYLGYFELALFRQKKSGRSTRRAEVAL
jgi:hypothetical protein